VGKHLKQTKNNLLLLIDFDRESLEVESFPTSQYTSTACSK